MTAKNKSNELYITRVYDAPVKVVWDAWADTTKAAQWWGPRGFTITTHSKDLKVGGIWHYTMHGPDGTDYPNKTKYHEVEKYKRLVYDHGGNDERAPLFRVTVDFTDLNGKTKMEMSMGFSSAEVARETEKFIIKAGGNATWDRLAEFLEHQSTGKDKFVINRSFNAPLDLCFAVWTNPKHIAKWLAPTGYDMRFTRSDIHVGSTTLYSMSGAGPTMHGKAKYLEITPPRRIVYTQQFCDEQENISRHPMAPTWPETMLTTVTLAEESPQQTRITIEWEVYGEATREERDMFHNAKAGMTQGWTGSFDKLAEYLKLHL